MEPALRASTRKTAWNASSAWWRSPRSCRQTRKTIGPYVVTGAANATSPAASRLAVNRSNRHWSVNPATEPPSKSDSICRTIVPDVVCAMPVNSRMEILGQLVPQSDSTPTRRILSRLGKEKSPEARTSRVASPAR